MSGTISGVVFNARGADVDMVVFRGKSIDFRIVWGGSSPMDISGATACLQARDAHGQLMMELSSANGRVTNGGPNGTFPFSAPPEVSRGVTKAGAFEIEMTTASGHVYRLMSGKVSFEEEIVV